MNRREFVSGAVSSIPAASCLLYSGKGVNGQATPSAQEHASDSSTLAPRFGDARDWWFQKRFGMFVHWGLYAAGGWHEQLEWRSGVPRAEYEKCFKQWNPRNFDPNAWLDLAEAADMEYICFTTKHHEGFCQWDTKLTDFKVTKTPYGKDVLPQLAEACLSRNFPLCLYYSIVDWHSPLYPNQGRSHELPPQPGDRPDLARYIEFVKGQVRELCTNYGKIGGFWWDMRVDKVDDHFINDMILSLQPAAVINNRGFDAGDYGTPERDYNRSAGLAPHLKGRVEACQSVGMESWGYRKDEDFYSHRHLTSSIAKFRACDANYLLNVGPGADGAIPEKPAQILRKIGAWYKSAREAFDGAIPSTELTDNRSILLTRKSNSVYVHLVEPPEGEELRLYPLAAAPLRAVLLNDGRPIEWRFDIAPMEWSGHKPYLRLHRLPVEEFAGTTMIVRLDFPNGEFAKVSRARKNGAVDPAAGVLAQ